MANSVTETLLGAVVLLTAAGFAVYGNQTVGLGAGGDGRYQLHASFNSVEGIATGTDVRMAGVKIGSVSRLGLNPQTYQAEVGLAIRDDIKLPEDSDVKIASEGLLGGNFVEITPGGSDLMLADGDEILLTQSAISFLNLLMKFVTGDKEEG
ncbi:outer membrane lipid asymmetry maintenance protein MlaD [Rhodobacteraceae bacterium 2CG4]|uniref:Outer membrane lipid asymmetry maintenance protein MlaD n=1 Tax=Halovulum marinum TaxID=2662447 RepID=A0A6L5YXT6_9RHOB|nr:outer membrane lipid asymmetry maintenance protein MlaD [Halovulum marinum]MSU89057.1 outer membrane lipid asymmetry maintenance protein MlaD [Halovulum marinum]